MKKYLVILCAVSSLFAQFNFSKPLVNDNLEKMSSASSDITDYYGYNTYSHAGNPLGILSYEDVLTSLRMGYKKVKLKSRANNDSSKTVNNVEIPYLRVGVPHKIYFDLYYSINPSVVSQSGSVGDPVDTWRPMSRFGYKFVGQIPDGRFKIGLMGNGYIGTEKWNENASHRTVLGADNIGIALGFQLSDPVSLEFFAHAQGFYDSLLVDGDKKGANGHYTYREASALIQLPQIDMDIDVGKDDFPYLSNLAVSYARNHFVYNEKPNGVTSAGLVLSGLSTYNDEGKADAIVCDSIGWNWKNMINADFSDVGTFRPAISFGFSHPRYRHMEPSGKNYPMSYDGEANGYEWETSSFNFGIGAFYSYKNMTDIWFEYGLATLGMKLTGKELYGFKDDVPSAHGYSKVGLGFKTNFDQIEALNFPKSQTFYFLFSFMFLRENALYGTYRDYDLRYMYDLPQGMSTASSDMNQEIYRYQPWEVMKNELKIFNTSFGLGASFADDVFDAKIHLGVLSQEYYKGINDKFKGVEFGVQLTYNKKESKSRNRSVTGNISDLENRSTSNHVILGSGE